MVKIVLICNAGMSTSMLVTKMKKAAQEKGLEADINAIPESQLAKNLEGINVVLLGPQVKFLLEKTKQLCNPNGIKVDLISSLDYGMMNGSKVLEQALSLAK